MQKVLYELKRVELVDLKPREGNSGVLVFFEKEGREKVLSLHFDLTNPVDIVNKILLGIKTHDKIIIDESDDILQNIYITRVFNEENIEDRLLNFFQDICAKSKKLKNLRDAREYMKLYDQMKIARLVLSTL